MSLCKVCGSPWAQSWGVLYKGEWDRMMYVEEAVRDSVPP